MADRETFGSKIGFGVGVIATELVLAVGFEQGLSERVECLSQQESMYFRMGKALVEYGTWTMFIPVAVGLIYDIVKGRN